MIIGGKLGLGLETGVSVGVGVWTGISMGVEVDVVVGMGVVPRAGMVLGVGLRRERGLGLIGRTGSKDCVGAPSTGVVGFVSVAAAAVVVGRGDSMGGAEIVGVGEVFFFFRCFGVGVGRTKSFFNLSPNDSSCS